MSETLIAALRKAADWGEDEFDVLSPQDAAAAADRIEALERELGWQDIATAPKATDEFGIGPWLLLFVPEGLDAPNMVTIGAYFREERRDDQGRFLGGEWTAVDADMIRSAYIKPTHWRPLPPPPTGERG